MQRRIFLTLGAAACAASVRAVPARAAADDAGRAFVALEAATGGRLGVYAREGLGGRELAYRGDERFPLCSTFKVLAVGAVLQRVDRGAEQLARRISYTTSDLEKYGPVTAAHVAEGSMTIAALCEAALVVSDNTAANLLLRTLGGPAGVTAFVRAHPFDDTMTRLDRNEPTLNTAIVGDPRDTSTPLRMANALALLLTTTEALTSASSRMLEGWMRDCTTGTTALRAGLPPSWVAGDKTGSGANGSRNDVALVRPPERPPIAIAAYLTGATSPSDDEQNAALAQVGRIVSAAFARTPHA